MDTDGIPNGPLRGCFALLESIGNTAVLVADTAADQIDGAVRLAQDVPSAGLVISLAGEIAGSAVRACGQAVENTCEAAEWASRQGLALAVGDLGTSSEALTKLASDVRSLAVALAAATGVRRGGQLPPDSTEDPV